MSLEIDHRDAATIMEVRNRVGLITLNQPKTLNALNGQLVHPFCNALQEWEKNPKVQAVILKSSSHKAFSGGGDVKAIIRRHKTLRAEISRLYRLLNVIGTSKLPQISLIDGLVVGAGIGLSIFGRYRIATERTILSMPETSIGNFTDCGASYYLPRLKNNLGIFLGLTGHKLLGKDAYFSGVATHYTHSQNLQELQKTLTSQENLNINRIDEILNYYHAKYEGGEESFSLAPYMEQIKKCFSGKTIEEIFKLLEEDNSEWALKCLNSCRKLSPTALKLSLRAILLSSKLQYLADATEMENKIAFSVLDRNEIYEGIRAMVIDRDYKPKWNPATIEEVNDNLIDEYFSHHDCQFNLPRVR